MSLWISSTNCFLPIFFNRYQSGNFVLIQSIVRVRRRTPPIEINETTKLVGSDAVGKDELCFSVSIDGDAMVIVAHQESDTGFTLRGAAHAFVRNPWGGCVE